MQIESKHFTWLTHQIKKSSNCDLLLNKNINKITVSKLFTENH